MHQPIVVSYGVGRDSTALLIEMQRRGLRPDAILFADTGSEKEQTYAYLPVIRRWLAEHGFPPLTIVRYQPRQNEVQRSCSRVSQNGETDRPGCKI